MLNFKELKKSKFSLLESVKIYKDMAFELFVPALKTSLIASIFILFGQTALSFVPYSKELDIVFWAWTLIIILVATTSFFKTAEDLILSKKPKIYDSISHILMLSVKLFAVLAMIAGVVGLLITPMFFLYNPLFSLPYKFLVAIFLIAAAPFVYFAPLAVVLRGADIINSFVFSYYMVLSRWSKVAKAMLVQLVFTAIIAFWVYFAISLIFFPNTSVFLDFLFTKATALTMLSHSLYSQFIVWEVLQVFALILMIGIFTGANTILFMHLEGTLFKLVKEKIKFKINHLKSVSSGGTHFIDVLAGGKSVDIDTSSVNGDSNEERYDKYDYDPEDFDDGYSEYQEQENFSMSDDVEDEEVEIINDEETFEQEENLEQAKEDAEQQENTSENDRAEENAVEENTAEKPAAEEGETQTSEETPEENQEENKEENQEEKEENKEN